MNGCSLTLDLFPLIAYELDDFDDVNGLCATHSSVNNAIKRSFLKRSFVLCSRQKGWYGRYSWCVVDHKEGDARVMVKHPLLNPKKKSAFCLVINRQENYAKCEHERVITGVLLPLMRHNTNFLKETTQPHWLSYEYVHVCSCGVDAVDIDAIYNDVYEEFCQIMQYILL